MTDPRAANCRGYHLDASGKVDGVLLEYRTQPSSLYELVKAELIGEAEAAGNTVATCIVLDRNGVQASERVYLAWPWPVLDGGKLLPGNPNGQHMVTNGYDAARGDIGPLALYIGDEKGDVISDAIGGLGLPNNRHVCYRVTWRERGAADGGGDGDTGGGGTGDNLAATNGLLQEIYSVLFDLARHLGVPGYDDSRSGVAFTLPPPWTATQTGGK